MGTQYLVFEYCFEHYQFFKVHSKEGDPEGSIHYLLSLAGYLFNAIALPLISMDLFISASIYFNPGLIVLDFMKNYLFVYPFLFTFDLIFILFFRHLTKHATKIPSIEKSKNVVNSK
ncbi:hypothetical protein [Methanolapillus millepedarum]|uniref:Uncharacterized protein n=1 Tax=Methanolapillus millepedarum TaxID=3028296 RepID=A0AA96V4X0_9EURY|nr:hypothetical protein MsAc7_14200 [Methanosarcinaceae archaeon Ac7]